MGKVIYRYSIKLGYAKHPIIGLTQGFLRGIRYYVTFGNDMYVDMNLVFKH